MKRILNYPGSKWTMASFINSIMPDNYTTYVEPFFGSGAVFFNKEPSTIETINDLDSRLVNFFRVCRDEPAALMQKVRMTPLSREEYELSYQVSDDAIEDARRMLVRSWQAIGGKTSDKTGWRANINVNGSKIHEWNHLDERISVVSTRLKQAQIEHQDAFKLLERYNRSNVLAYVDPPYLLSTRTKRHYKHEFNDADHEVLLDQLLNFKGYVILSGYESEMYNSYLSNWSKVHFEVGIESGGRAIETLWCNYPIQEPTKQLELI